MIKYHVVGLLCLAVAAIAGIEAAAQFYESVVFNNTWYTNFKGWLMVGVVLLALVVYLRARKFRKREVWKDKS